MKILEWFREMAIRAYFWGFMRYLLLIMALVFVSCAVGCEKLVASDGRGLASGNVRENVARDCVVELDGRSRVVQERFISLGVFRITYYWTGEDGVGVITKTGTRATVDRTIAVDPNVIPLGSVVLVGDREYIAEDIGGAVKGKAIDIYVDRPMGNNAYGVDFMEVKVLDKKGGFDG